MTTTTARPDVGSLLREWRQRRRFSQLEVSVETGVSARHLSFLETGRARPSREMLLRLSQYFDVPLRERNELLLAAGFAPVYSQHGLGDPEMGPVRAAIDVVLGAYGPHPALVVDRGWNLVAANHAVQVLLAGVRSDLLMPSANALRLSLHPDGLAPRIVNLAQWRANVLHRVSREAAVTGDPGLAALHAELLAYPGGLDPEPPAAIAVPLRLLVDGPDGPVELAFISTITTFGTAVDVTVAELSLEAFLPADEQTTTTMRGLVPNASRR